MSIPTAQCGDSNAELPQGRREYAFAEPDMSGEPPDELRTASACT
jgi:hypothetical protein